MYSQAEQFFPVCRIHDAHNIHLHPLCPCYHIFIQGIVIIFVKSVHPLTIAISADVHSLGISQTLVGVANPVATTHGLELAILIAGATFWFLRTNTINTDIMMASAFTSGQLAE